MIYRGYHQGEGRRPTIRKLTPWRGIGAGDVFRVRLSNGCGVSWGIDLGNDINTALEIENITNVGIWLVKFGYVLTAAA